MSLLDYSPARYLMDDESFSDYLREPAWHTLNIFFKNILLSAVVTV